MKINNFTNYSFRILIMLAANPERTVSLSEVAQAYQISLNHLKKVSARLIAHQLVVTERGRTGGLKLLRNPSDIRLGEIFRISQTDTAFVECLAEASEPDCVISPACKLQSIFQEALSAFEAVMDRYTVSDLVQNKAELSQFLTIHVAQLDAEPPQ